MASRKTTVQKKTGGTAKETADGRQPKNDRKKQKENAPQSPARARRTQDPDSTLHQVLPYVFYLAALLILIFLIWGNTSGFVGIAFNRALFTVFGKGAWAIPALFIMLGLRWRRAIADGTVASRFIFMLVIAVTVSSLVSLLSDGEELAAFEGGGGLVSAVCASNGGFVGGFAAIGLLKSIGKIAALILGFMIAFISLMFFLSITFRDIIVYFRYNAGVSRERRESRREARMQRQSELEEKAEAMRAAREEKKRLEALRAAEEEKQRRKAEKEEKQRLEEEEKERERLAAEALAAEEAAEKATGAEIPPIQDYAAANQNGTASESAGVKAGPDTRLQIPDLDRIFNHEAPEGAKNELAGLPDGSDPEEEETEEEEKAQEKKPEYVFPPLSLLHDPVVGSSDTGDREITEKAERLVATLESFNVHTKVVNISKGPAITRYELQPMAGTSVKSIANRIDDIALNMESIGVRIEAPIPGKSAVGVEVPNKKPSTVYLKQPLTAPQFTSEENKKRRLLTCLGVDVVGVPVYCDLAKMPHLLIAGATGMGKSVSINSMIMSILYRSTPDEVKLILIDPKKVEFSVYAGIPHLLVPVVSDPEKAAGALAWAVNEMERRYSLLEEVGVRDMTGYNSAVAGVEGYEQLPLIVIVIDELADLMIVARDTVEKSINRIAAKARAAGMHLVLGTQRPSVDVITGVIKNNIPSRIAFKVTSQVDSRTILDVAGAERLVGRGDMLYAATGLMKPIRVQGSFVDDEEVRSVATFIREHYGVNNYNEEIIADIDRETQNCRNTKGGADTGEGGEEDGELDPKFRESLELAVQSNKIATSMLQRNLSVGYGRAAKIIDQLERCGYVGPPDGTKPRKVLITMQQYRELVVNDMVGRMPPKEE